MGPHYANFRAITESLITHNAIKIANKENFTRTLVDLLTGRERAFEMGHRAKEVFDREAGATDRCVAALKTLLTGGGQAA
jgi:3-deoxy-D-manno-octulosonic-acid transferase